MSNRDKGQQICHGTSGCAGRNLKDKLHVQVIKRVREQFYGHVDGQVDWNINGQVDWNVNGQVRMQVSRKVRGQVLWQVYRQCLNLVKNVIDMKQLTRWELLKLKGLRLINNLTRYK